MNSFTTYSAARKNLKGVFDKVCEDHAPCFVERRNGADVVIVSAQDYAALEETAYLLSSPNNSTHLADSIKEMENEETIEIDI